MKAYLLLPLALLAGLVLGGWGPRSDVRELTDELRQTKALLRQAHKKGRRSDVDQVTRLLGIDAESAHDSREISSGAGPAVATNDTPGDTTVATNAPTSARTHREDRPRPDRSTDMETEIEAAIELWELRSDIARSTFLANGNLSDKDALAFDVLIEAMNLRLTHAIEQWVTALEAKEKASAEDGIRLMNQVTDVLVLTYDEMDRKLPENWRSTAGQSMQLMDFINPAVARPLISAETKLDNIGRSFDDSSTSADEN